MVRGPMTPGVPDPNRQPPRMLDPVAPVPRMRADLKISADLSAGTGGVTVEDPRAGRSHSLKDFELSLARMLNGKRSGHEVLEAAQRIGLPVTLESLARFVDRMRGLGLLDEPHAPPSIAPAGIPNTTWPGRENWPEGTRALFQDALKAFRSDELDECFRLLEQLLQHAPGMPEAAALLVQVQQKQAQLGSGTAPVPFAREWSAAEQGWFRTGERPAMADPALEPDAAPQRRSKLPLVVLGLLLMLGAAALLVPFPHTVQGPATLKARASQSVTLPLAGTLAAVEVRDGQQVPKGAVLARYDGAATKAAVEAAKAKVADVEGRLKKASAPTPKRKKAQAAADKAGAALKKATADAEKAEAQAKGKKTAALAKAQKKKAAAEKAVEKAKAALAAAGGDTSALDAELAEAKKALAAAEADAAATEVLAPLGGQVVGVAVKAGAKVAKDAALLRIDDAAVLLVDLEVGEKDAAAMKPGLEFSLRVGNKKVSAKVTKAGAEGVEAEVDNAKGELKAGATGTATINLGGRSVLGRL